MYKEWVKRDPIWKSDNTDNHFVSRSILYMHADTEVTELWGRIMEIGIDRNFVLIELSV